MTSFHELARRAENLPEPALDIEALVAEGDRRLRRRRTAALVAVAGVVIALVLGGVLVDSGARRANAPIDQPNRHDKSDAPIPRSREIVYADGLHGRSIHFGGQVVRTGVAFTHIDVTDDGFVYSTGGYRGDGRLWFSDGGTPVLIGSHACEAAHGFATTAVTSNTGSRIAWLECTSDTLQSLVVFDTSSMREVFRRSLPPCEQGGDGGECALEAMVGDDAYLIDAYTRHPDGRIRTRGLVLDLRTSALTQVSAADQQYADATDSQAYITDARSLARGLVVGENERTGRPTDGIGLRFSVVGARTTLAPHLVTPAGEELDGAAWSIATGRPVRLRLPHGYDFPGRANDYVLFEWLDDDDVALIAGGGGWDGGRSGGDILTCRLTDGRCRLAVHGPAPRTVRVVPHLDLPG